jgi:hypothetical protein
LAAVIFSSTLYTSVLYDIILSIGKPFHKTESHPAPAKFFAALCHALNWQMDLSGCIFPGKDKDEEGFYRLK